MWADYEGELRRAWSTYDGFPVRAWHMLPHDRLLELRYFIKGEAVSTEKVGLDVEHWRTSTFVHRKIHASHCCPGCFFLRWYICGLQAPFHACYRT